MTATPEAKPFLRFYQDFTHVYPTEESEHGIAHFSLEESLWVEWLNERQKGCRWIIGRRWKEGDAQLDSCFEWRERWKCNHGGCPSTRLTNVSPQKKRKRESSIKVGCKATITFAKKKSSSLVAVTWRYQHSGHEPLSIYNWRRSSILGFVKGWIQERVHEGRDWKSIHDLLRVDQAELEALDNTSLQIPQALRVKRMDVYNTLRKEVITRSQLDTDLNTSLVLWIAKIIDEDGWGYVDGLDVAFATSWQRTLWDPTTVCLDATHKTCQDNYLLYSVVIRSKITGRGAPIAFLLTQDASSAPLIKLLEHLPISPSFFMIDCSFTEALAIQTTHPDATILYCDWHVLQSISKNARIHIKGIGKADSSKDRELQQEAMSDFTNIMQLKARDRYTKLHLNNVDKWHLKGFPKWSQYLATTWHPHHKRWVKAWRQEDHDGINTNNYIERWHGRLKTKYLGSIRGQRPDYLIHLLVDKIVLDYQQEAKQSELGLVERTLNKAESLSMSKAQQEDFSLVMENAVKSFTSNAVYDILPDGQCSCPAEKPCKHMFLQTLSIADSAPLQALPLLISDIQAPLTTFDAIAQEKEHLTDAIKTGIERLVRLSQQLSANASRQQLSDLEARLISLNHLTADVVFKRSASSTQS